MNVKKERRSSTHLCPPLRSTFAVRETASLGIMGEPRVPLLNPSETIVLWEHYRLWGGRPHYGERQSLGQQFLNATVGINGLNAGCPPWGGMSPTCCVAISGPLWAGVNKTKMNLNLHFINDIIRSWNYRFITFAKIFFPVNINVSEQTDLFCHKVCTWVDSVASETSLSLIVWNLWQRFFHIGSGGNCWSFYYFSIITNTQCGRDWTLGWLTWFTTHLTQLWLNHIYLLFIT